VHLAVAFLSQPGNASVHILPFHRACNWFQRPLCDCQLLPAGFVGLAEKSEELDGGEQKIFPVCLRQPNETAFPWSRNIKRGLYVTVALVSVNDGPNAAVQRRLSKKRGLLACWVNGVVSRIDPAFAEIPANPLIRSRPRPEARVRSEIGKVFRINARNIKHRLCSNCDNSPLVHVPAVLSFIRPRLRVSADQKLSEELDVDQVEISVPRNPPDEASRR
jgi:hypothetical protein